MSDPARDWTEEDHLFWQQLSAEMGAFLEVERARSEAFDRASEVVLLVRGQRYVFDQVAFERDPNGGLGARLRGGRCVQTSARRGER